MLLVHDALANTRLGMLFACLNVGFFARSVIDNTLSSSTESVISTLKLVDYIRATMTEDLQTCSVKLDRIRRSLQQCTITGRFSTLSPYLGVGSSRRL